MGNKPVCLNLIIGRPWGEIAAEMNGGTNLVDGKATWDLTDEYKHGVTGATLVTAKCQALNQAPGEVETELVSLWSLMRFLSLRLKPKAAARPRMGSGPGTEDVRVTSVDKSALKVRVPEPVKSRNVGKARESAASTPTRGSALISAMENSVTPVRPKSAKKKYSRVPSEIRSEKVVPPTIKSKPLKPDGRIKLRNSPLSNE